MDTEQPLEGGPGILAIAVRCPVAGVVDDGAKRSGLALEPLQEVEDAVFAGEVRLEGDDAALAHGLELRALAAIADDHRLAVLHQALGAVTPQTLGATGNQDRRRAHDCFSPTRLPTTGTRGSRGA